MPTFSVVIPTHKRRDLLARCLETLTAANQGIPESAYEVIVGDDERSPETALVVKTSLPNARYIEGPSRGPAANRNHAAAHATGEWLVFTDDDCIPQENWLRSFASAICQDIEVYEGKTTCKAGFRSPLDRAPANETGGYLWSCNMMINRALFKTMGGFDEGFGAPAMEDVDLRERLRDLNHKILFVSSAEIDHPPRKLKGLAELITIHRSVYRFEVLKRRSAPKLTHVLVATTKQNIRACLRPNFRDLPRALCLFAGEILVVCVRGPIWHRQFTRMSIREDAGR
jgi:GT2 family glycosyltransferase